MGETKNQNLKYSNLLIAFVDILGFKKMVEDSRKDREAFEKIRNALTTINEEKTTERGEVRYKVKTFSDNIVISCLASDGLEAFYKLIIKLIKLEANLLQSGVLVRGGIAKGEAYHVEDMVFGPAMVEAYELESKYAVYPRIIVEKNVVDWAKDQMKDTDEDHRYARELDSLLKPDEYNEIYYIDILNRDANDISNAEYVELMKEVKQIIESGLKSRSKEVLKKYIWLKNYYNNKAQKSNIKKVNNLIIPELQETDNTEEQKDIVQQDDDPKKEGESEKVNETLSSKNNEQKGNTSQTKDDEIIGKMDQMYQKQFKNLNLTHKK